MRVHLKAYYNLLKNHPPAHAEKWQVEDYRELPTHEIFNQIQSLGISLDDESFLIYAQPHENPETFTDFIWADKENKDHVYLLLFELWRRLLPEKQSLSIIGDELDARIDAKGPVDNILLRIDEILNEMLDEGMSPREAFQSFSQYCSHDVESFLYEYLSDLIEENKSLDASDLLDRFYPFFLDTSWFDFLRARILTPTDPHEANIVFKSLLEELKEEPDLDLLLEMAAFLVHHGDPHLFQQATSQAFELLTIEEDFQELIATVADYYQCIDQEKEAEELQTLFKKRKDKPLDQPLNRADPDLVVLNKSFRSNF